MLKRHLFLTGAKQVGKSTLLRRLIEEKSLDCAGFETRAFFIDGERRGFTLHGRVSMPPYENDCIVCARIGEKMSVPVPQTFNTNGVAILQRSLAAPAPFLLMDELGKLERSADAFCAQVLATLDSDKRVLGVLQKCDSTLIDAIIAREDVSVLTVTQENRDALLDELIEWV